MLDAPISEVRIMPAFTSLAEKTRAAAATPKINSQRRGTLFTSEGQLTDYIADNGDLPGGEVIYLDFDVWQPADFGAGFNDPPSILILHNRTGDALMKNLHGQFRGAIIADRIEHINGDYRIIGGIISFADSTFSHVLGMGNAQVLYSSSVLGQIPSIDTTSS